MHVYNLHMALTEQPTAQTGFLDYQLHHLNTIPQSSLQKILGVA